MIITDEALLRVESVPVLPEEIGPLRDQLERELIRSAARGHEGVGLAAVQIGIPQQMAIVRTKDYSVDLINCEIVKGYDKAIFENEGCLSFPGRFERTWRYQEIHINNNAEPKNKEFVARGFLAVICQHELDHLDGRLLPDVAIPSLNLNPENLNKTVFKREKRRPNELCFCGSSVKFKRCCGIKR